MKDWTDKLVQLNACREAVEWAKGYPTLTTAWAACDRADWMLWLAGKVCRTLPQRKRLVLAACACARTALRYVKVGEKRPRAAIRTAERWAHGDRSVSLQDVRSADADAAAAGERAAAYAAYAAAAAAATSAAYTAYEVYAAYAAAAAATSAAYAATSAAYAATSAAYAAARTKTLARMAKIVRKHYPAPPRTR